MWWRLFYFFARKSGLRRRKKPLTIIAFRPFALR
jgi:hypothetical protein